MTTLDPHPFSAMSPSISDDDFGKLAADIKLNGLHQPIIRYQGKILDGNNRYRACELVKIVPKFVDFNGDDAQARNNIPISAIATVMGDAGTAVTGITIIHNINLPNCAPLRGFEPFLFLAAYSAKRDHRSAISSKIVRSCGVSIWRASSTH
jgi:hypothetical protein